MAILTRQYDRRVFTSRSWSPNFYDTTTLNFVNMVEISSDYKSIDGPRTSWGELILTENPFTLYRSKVQRGAARCVFVNDSLKRYITTWDYPPASLPAPEVSTYARAMLNGMWRELVSKVGELKANLALMIAERQETVNLLSKGLKMIYQFSKAVRRGNWRDAFAATGARTERGGHHSIGGATKYVANTYLALNLGLLPIAKDIYGLINKELRPPTLRVRKRTKIAVEDVVALPGNYGVFPTQLSTTINVCVTAKADIPTLDYFAANIAQQLGAANPAALAWELLPYSFVVNWFVDIASFLAQFTAFSGLRIIECSETVTVTTAVIGQTYRLTAAPGGFDFKVAGSSLTERSKGSRKSKIRVTIDRPPYLPPAVPIPGLSVGKMVTLSALVAQYRLR